MRRSIAFIAAAAALLVLSGRSAAHEFRPAIVEVRALGEGRWEVFQSDAEDSGLSLSFPPGCARESANAGLFVIRCDADLAGRSITVRGLGGARGDALVRYEGPGGPATAALREGSASFTVPGDPGRSSALARAKGYLGAGIAHVLEGADHLLFVLGLLLLAERRLGAVARAVTAFTLAHSITLALAATAAVTLPPAPVEALIALSLVLLAAEIARARRDGAASIPARRPSHLAFGFGLLHGFGFAGGLADLRVPTSDLPLALLGFNTGVELGQLAFVIACLLVLRLLASAPSRYRVSLAPAYLIGSMGAFFTLDRLSGLWRP